MLSRRAVMGVGAVSLAVGGCGSERAGEDGTAAGARRTPLRQRGVTDPQPRHVLLLAYDAVPLAPRGSAGPREVLDRWHRLLPAGPGAGASQGPTATIALGPRSPGMLGLPAPALLGALPSFAGDRLDPAAGAGDLLVQICGRTARECGDLGAVFDAAAGTGLRPRWRQPGFLPAAPPGQTPRNLLGFKDGTANPTAEEAERWVWVTGGPHAGGSYLVLRRIRLRTEEFLGLPVARQEGIIGRRRAGGGPLGGGGEHREVDLFAKTPEGRYLLPADAHVRLAHSRYDAGARMQRRGYSYDNGPGDRGLLFLAYMNDPGLFVRVQRRLAAGDALLPFTETFGSGVYFVPSADLLHGRAAGG